MSPRTDELLSELRNSLDQELLSNSATLRIRGWYASDLPSFHEFDAYVDGSKKDRGDKLKLAQSKLIASTLGHQENLSRPSDDALDSLSRLPTIKLQERERIARLSCGADSCIVLTTLHQMFVFGGSQSSLVVGFGSDERLSSGYSRFRMPVRKVAVGSSHCFLQVVSGELYSWGINTDRDVLAMNRSSDSPTITGLLGHSITSPVSTSALRVTLLYTNIVDFASGPGHTCVLVHKGDDKVIGFGSNSYGQLGVVRKTNLNSVIMDQLQQRQLTNVYCGGEFTLALDSMGITYAWGSNSHGQLGIGKGKASSNVVTVSYEGFRTGTRIVSLACGFAHCLALTNTGRLYSWGDGRRGALGRPWKAFEKPKLVQFFSTGSPKVVSISAFGHRSQAVTDLGLVYEWGALESRNLLRDQDVPLLVQSLSNDGQFIELTAMGTFHSAYVEDPAMKSVVNLLNKPRAMQMNPEFFGYIMDTLLFITASCIDRCYARMLSDPNAVAPRISVNTLELQFDMNNAAIIFPCQSINVKNHTGEPLYVEILPSHPSIAVLPSQHIQLAPGFEQPVAVQVKEPSNYFCSVLRITVTSATDQPEKPIWVFCHRRIKNLPGIPQVAALPKPQPTSTSSAETYLLTAGEAEEQPCVLKRLHKRDALLADQVLFRQEIFLLSQLANHKSDPAARNIVQLLGATEDDSYISYATEYYEFSLRNILDELGKQTLQPEQLFPLTDHLVANFLGQIAGGLRFLVSLPFPLYFREISSTNIFVQSVDFVMKIGHTGSSSPIARGQRLAESMYTASNNSYSERHLVFELGLLLYELLTLESARDATVAPALSELQRTKRQPSITALYDEMTHQKASHRPKLKQVIARLHDIATNAAGSSKKAKKGTKKGSTKKSNRVTH